MLTALAFLLLVAAAGVHGAAAPRPTLAAMPRAPAPVAAGPVTAAVEHLNRIIKRQTTSSDRTYTLTLAPDETCGFLSASVGVGITCPNKLRCMWESENIKRIICGVGFEYAFNRCIEREAAIDPSRCDDVCQSNTYNLRCTQTNLPYCRTYAYPGGIQGYTCASSTITAPQSVSFTYRGQTGRTFSTLVLATTTPTSRPGSTTSITTPTTTPTTSSTLTISTTTTLPPDSSTSGGSSNQNIPAIVGGTVGGIAVIGLFALGIVFLTRKYRKTPETAATATVATGPAGGDASTYNQTMSMHGQPGQPPVMIGHNTGSPVSGAYMFDNKTPGVASNVSYPPSQTSPTTPYDAVSIASQQNRLSTQGYPAPQQQPQQPVQYPGYTMSGHPQPIPEMAADSSGDHRGEIHEMR